MFYAVDLLVIFFIVKSVHCDEVSLVDNFVLPCIGDRRSPNSQTAGTRRCATAVATSAKGQ